MAIMIGVVGALSAFFHDNMDIRNPEHRQISADRLIAKIPTIAAMGVQILHWSTLHVPQEQSVLRRKLPAHDVQHPSRRKPINPKIARAMDRIFMLHADHEQNASTSTVRLAGSTGANPSPVSPQVSQPWGPAHGGANEAVLKMLEQIGDESNIDKFIAKAKDKDDPFRLMGFRSPCL